MKKIFNLYLSVTAVVIVMPLAVIYIFGGQKFVRTDIGDVLSKSTFIISPIILYTLMRNLYIKRAIWVALVAYVLIAIVNIFSVEWKFDLFYLLIWLALGIYCLYAAKE